MGLLINNEDIITGCAYVVLGILVKLFPVLIAGYNTMPKKEKEQINIQKFSVYMCKLFVFWGLLYIGLSFLFKIIECNNFWDVYKYFHVIILIVILFMTKSKYIKK